MIKLGKEIRRVLDELSHILWLSFFAFLAMC